MRVRFVALLAAASLGVAVPVVASAEPANAAPLSTSHTCGSGYSHAALPWGHKCLRRGQFCKISGDRYYHRYGYHCHTGRLT
jgi:hypothetical protein